MAEQRPSSSQNTSDEIDLGHLLRLIQKAFNNVFRGFLRAFLYLKKNFFKLTILILIGFAIGILLKFVVADKLKTEIIVKPNFDSKDYLYDVVDEIETNLKTKDTTFFRDLGIVIGELKNLRIEIEQIQEDSNEGSLEDDLKYLEALQNYKDNSFVLDVVRAEIQKKSGMNHRITFIYKNALAGSEASRRLMSYINTNDYFDEVKKISLENAASKIERNMDLIKQIDIIIAGYSENLTKSNFVDQGTIVLENEKSLDIPSLLTLKNGLLKEIERKKLEIVEQKDIINIINFGKTQKVRTPIYAQGILVLPIILVGLFFLISFLRYLNEKAGEI